MKTFLAATLFSILLCSSILAIFSIYKVPPWKKMESHQTKIWIPPGSTPRTMANILHDHQIIDIPVLFRMYTRVTKKDRLLKPGEYAFTTPTTIAAVVHDLVNENVVKWKLTVKEGWNIRDILKALESENFEEKEQLENILHSPDLLKPHSVENAKSLEGFLYPDTYFFTRTDTARKIAETMVRRFFSNISDADVTRAQELGFNLLEWVTLGSIVEKESGVVREQPLIASVFHNRLQKKMRLQSDPTVIYGIESYEGNITKKHLLTPTPYNTYTISGLPPGPIASPSKTALQAVLHPADTNYLFFVGKGNGEHFFSETYDVHQKAVQNFQIDPARRAKVQGNSALDSAQQ